MITSRDGELSDMVMEAIGTNMDQYGIELLKFETKQLDLPDDNKEAVYERMILNEIILQRLTRQRETPKQR